MIALKIDRPWQLEVIECVARLMFLSAGRGAGKTTCCSRNRLVYNCLRHTDHIYSYFSPSYSIAKREFRTISKCRALRPFITDSPVDPYPQIIFSTGSKLNFRSLDREENVLGEHLDGAVIDEAHVLWEDLLDSWILPQLAAKRGWALLMGQFDEGGSSDAGWLYNRYYLPGQQPNQTTFKSWIVPSSMGVMFSGEDGAAELQRIKERTNPLVFRRQYLGEPIESANLAFRADDLKGCLGGSVVSAGGDFPVILAHDIGRTVDPAAWLAVRPVSRESLVVLNSGIRPIGERYEVGAQELSNLQRIYRAGTVIIDNSGGGQGGHGPKESLDAFATYYKGKVNNIRPFFFSYKLKTQLAETLQLMIEQKRIQIPAELAQLRKQLSEFRWEHRRYLSFSGPGGHGDDLVAALLMAIHATMSGWWRQPGQTADSFNSALM
jgi:hypothetical protein